MCKSAPFSFGWFNSSMGRRSFLPGFSLRVSDSGEAGFLVTFNQLGLPRCCEMRKRLSKFNPTGPRGARLLDIHDVYVCMYVCMCNVIMLDGLQVSPSAFGGGTRARPADHSLSVFLSNKHTSKFCARTRHCRIFVVGFVNRDKAFRDRPRWYPDDSQGHLRQLQKGAQCGRC